MGEGIVCRVIYHHATATLDILHKRLVGLLGPAVAIVIQHHNIILLKVGCEATHIATRRLGKHNIALEESRLIQNKAQHAVAHLPIMVVLTRDNQHLMLLGFCLGIIGCKHNQSHDGHE